MVPGVQCALILGGIQWLLASYVSNLDSQNTVLHVDSNTSISTILMRCIIIIIIGSMPLVLYHRLIDFRLRLASVHCAGSEQRLIDCSHNYTRSCLTQHIIFPWRAAAAVECQIST